MKHALTLLTALLLAPLAALRAADAPKMASKPNIVHSFSDDQPADTIHALGKAPETKRGRKRKNRRDDQ